jgi:hypothetical protein
VTAGSCTTSMFSFIRYCQTVSQNICNIFHSYQQRTRQHIFSNLI